MGNNRDFRHDQVAAMRMARPKRTQYKGPQGRCSLEISHRLGLNNHNRLRLYYGLYNDVFLGLEYPSTKDPLSQEVITQKKR